MKLIITEQEFVQIEKLITKYNMKTMNDLFKMNLIELLRVQCIFNYEYIFKIRIQAAVMDQLNLEREFINTNERNGLPFPNIAIRNFFVDDSYNGEVRNQISEYGYEALKGGMKLLRYIFKANGFKDQYRKSFFKSVNDVLNSKVDKINTICFVGTSDSGKSVMANLITDYLMCGRVSGNCNIFQSTPNKRVILIEECLIPTHLVGDYKMLFEGCKYLNVGNNNIIGWKTPVVTTSSKIPWHNVKNEEDISFRNRSIIYNFHAKLNKNVINNIMKKNPKSVYQNKLILSPIHYQIMKRIDILGLYSRGSHKYIKEVSERIREWIKNDGNIAIKTLYSNFNNIFKSYIEDPKEHGIFHSLYPNKCCSGEFMIDNISLVVENSSEESITTKEEKDDDDDEGRE